MAGWWLFVLVSFFICSPLGVFLFWMTVIVMALGIIIETVLD